MTVENANSTISYTNSSTNLSFLSVDPQELINEALAPIADKLDQLAVKITDFTGASTTTSKAVIRHTIGAGGKRIRPALYFLASRLVGYSGDHLYPMAAVCEFVHTASLLHDDVVDSSPVRRNKPTAKSIWGDEASVLTGDLIYARASEMMAATGSLEIVSLFARAIRLMSDGELLQLEHIFDTQMPRDAYFTILEHKTAVLLAACCKAPAILVGRTSDEVQALETFGRAVGFAFQLLDDALDYAGTDDIFGKKTLADLPEGKITLPIILLREQATAADWNIVANIIAQNMPSKVDMQRVHQLVDQYDTAGQTLALAEEWTNTALDSLDIFPASPEREGLERLARSLLMRVH